MKDSGRHSTRQKTSKRIIKKPWGQEELGELNNKYVIKFLVVNKGHKLSKQYHNAKLETMVLLRGNAILELGKTWQTMKLFNLYTIRPKMVHRIVALSDTKILEVSTPRLKDVVRLEDDYNRV